MQRWSAGELTLAGIALLMASLVVRHVEALQFPLRIGGSVVWLDPLSSITSWGGAILVIVGLGKILFLGDRHDRHRS